ncbi:lysylphosphatidylglycerol synthase domain-containing protein [Psychrosphaera sp. 1_MG-2023]|uniref:lysylphosphatidylglycerol synthase domain-containing protein n=1 Tax=Psychrosphaera sp. 1_MG-2023 TaxID=3062643 RepID=UPI0026E3009B|nr:lysylphosphatidylglycerol synthase domain-containing protein [Psychrosphaera sp. 1_MG-2023]MDO6719166.1 lysylphosphatidylglycerol synthase domain-containing protein [Psychrosphaera sp. 1_MG-2023]
MKKILFYLASFLIFIATIYITEKNIGWRTIIVSLADIPLQTLSGLVALSILNYVLRMWRIRWSLQLPSNASVTVFYITTSHNLWNILMPMRLGEASFPLLIKQHFAIDYVTSSSHLLLFRLLDLAVLLSIFVLTLCLVTVPMMFIPCLVVITLMFWAAPYLLSLISVTLKKTQFSVGQRVALALEQLSGNQHQLALISITTWGIWALKLLAFVLFCIFASGLPAFDALMSIIIADLSSILPIHGFAGTGTFEGAFVLGGLQTGATTDALLQAAVQLHLYLIFVATLATFIGYCLHLMVPTTLKTAK